MQVVFLGSQMRKTALNLGRTDELNSKRNVKDVFFIIIIQLKTGISSFEHSQDF